jgi:uncharacterized membrane protein HdeD (DUF308 family)
MTIRGDPVPGMAACYVVWTNGSWRYHLTLGIIGMVVGTVFFLFPDLSLHLVVYLFAFIALLVAGILFAIALFISRGSGGFFLVPLSLGILALLIAVLSLLCPDCVAAFIAVLIGAACLLVGLGWVVTAGFQPAPGGRRLVTVIGGIILAALGVLIILHAQLTLPVIFQIIGAFLIAAGAVSAIGGLVLWRRERSPDPRVIDVYIEE